MDENINVIGGNPDRQRDVSFARNRGQEMLLNAQIPRLHQKLFDGKSSGPTLGSHSPVVQELIQHS